MRMFLEFLSMDSSNLVKQPFNSKSPGFVRQSVTLEAAMLALSSQQDAGTYNFVVGLTVIGYEPLTFAQSV